MGYTHYFTQKMDCPPELWAHICDSMRRLMATALINHDPLQIQQQEDDPSPPLIDHAAIVFNGIGQDAHETMVLNQKLVEEPWQYSDLKGFNCCKTAYKPYDRVVVALLCLADYFAPGVWLISSDGDEEDWEAGLALARTVEPNCPMVTFDH